jgi:3-mercaptopyruvate sulfurtransferase SseA
MTAVSLWGVLSVAQQQPRYPVDPQTKWAIGAKPKSADELKKQLDGGSTVLIIDVRPSASFEKETIPGAINIPLAELEGHLKQMSKDTFIVFT